ncbi:hypothetical protein [Rhizobium mongolense]|nr:hypothetical protein [Rhizobium mongolense]
MSERTFQRRFRSLTGLPPLKWIRPHPPRDHLCCAR